VRVAYEVMRSFCKDSHKYKIHIGHSALLDLIMSAIKLPEKIFLRIMTDKAIVKAMLDQRNNSFSSPHFIEEALKNSYGISKEAVQIILSYFKISSSNL